MDEEKPQRVFRGKFSHIWNDKELFQKMADESSSITEMLSKLGIPRNAGNFSTIKSASLLYGIELPIFDSKDFTKAATMKITLSDEEIFSNRGIKSSSVSLVNRLLKNHNVKYECVGCKNDGTWQGEKIVLELDHIDGNSFNNIRENLRLLCPNCHSQTSNFRGKNVDRVYNYCPECSKRINKDSEKCDNHARTDRNVKKHEENALKYGALEDLYQLYVEKKTFTELGRHYNISTNAIRKYIRNFGISIDDFRNGKFDLAI